MGFGDDCRVFDHNDQYRPLSIKRVKNSGDYYVVGRSFGPLVLMATVCATIIGGSGLMGRAGVAYSSGFKVIMTAIP